MMTFNSVKELINTLGWSKELLKEMFEKRKSLMYRYEDALNLDLGEDKVDSLINRGVIRRSGSFIELDEIYLQFFEQVLEVNEEINTYYINENILQVKQNIDYYLAENNENRRHHYLKSIKAALRKTGRIIIRNVVDLNRNIDNTFKTEPNYKIKKAKLENYDAKRENITDLIEQTEKLIIEDERTFFRTALDEEMRQIVLLLRMQLIESRHNLIEVQKQIIEYLNQIKYQSKVLEKLRQLKYLRDQFELESRTTIREVLTDNQAVVFEPNPAYPLKLSIRALQHDDAYDSLLKVFQKMKLELRPKLPVAGAINDAYLQNQTENEVIISLEELMKKFRASGTDLFSFMNSYEYPRTVSLEEQVTLFCQMVSLYETDLNISETYEVWNGLEYALVYPNTNPKEIDYELTETDGRDIRSA
jgi:hypothetical protein